MSHCNARRIAKAEPYPKHLAAGVSSVSSRRNATTLLPNGGSGSDCLDGHSGLSVTGQHDHHSNEVKERRRHQQDPA